MVGANGTYTHNIKQQIELVNAEAANKEGVVMFCLRWDLNKGVKINEVMFCPDR